MMKSKKTRDANKRNVFATSFLMLAFCMMSALFLGGLTRTMTSNAAGWMNIISTGYYTLGSSGNNGLVMGLSSQTAGTTDLSLQARSGNPVKYAMNQIIYVKKYTSGSYRNMYTLQLAHSGKYIGISSNYNGARVVQTSTPTYYRIYGYDDGTYTFYSPGNNKCIDVSSGNFRIGQKLWAYQMNGTKAQRFKFKYISSSKPSVQMSFGSITANYKKGKCTISVKNISSNYLITNIYGVWNGQRVNFSNPYVQSMNFVTTNSAVSHRTYTLKLYITTGATGSAYVKTINVKIP